MPEKSNPNQGGPHTNKVTAQPGNKPGQLGSSDGGMGGSGRNEPSSSQRSGKESQRPGEQRNASNIRDTRPL